MVMVKSKLDRESYTAHGLACPEGGTVEAVERFLADTGASVCLAGTGYMQAMGVSRKDLIRCDMSVRGAGGKSIPVL